MKKLVLIDGKSVFYRGYYAMGALGLPDGTPTGGVFGFAAISTEIVKKLGPTKVVVAWDSKTSTARRRAIYPDYKAGRVKPGEDFYAQIPLLKTLVLDLGWNFVEIDEYEADDIIGTLAKEASENNYETYIISSDLDMLQIVDKNIHMWRILKGFSEIEEINVPELEKKYGILKSQFLDLKALKGDASDNIPGVPGIGEKGAAKLLTEFGSLDKIYENLGKIQGATKEKLIAGKNSAFMSRDLAKIEFNAPVKLENLKDFEFNPEKVLAGLKKLEFNSLIKKFNLEENISEEKTPETENSETNEKLDIIIDYDIKSLMHLDKSVAKKVLSGAPFWDLNQAAFLLDPLSRESTTTSNRVQKYRDQEAALKQLPRLYNIYTNFDLPLIPILYKMETRGMLIDRDYFKNLKTEYEAEVKKLEREVIDLAGVDFNPNSPGQLSGVLFDHLRLPTAGIKKILRGYSTGAKELEKLRDAHPIVPKIIEYREAAKLLSTYITPMPELADSHNRIHTTFTQNVTSTGRLSSKDPNLQNIPVRTEEGKRIRTGFVAPEGCQLVSADYSQFELRLAAVLARDANLIASFNSGVDIHTKTAAEAFNIPFEQVTKQQRRAAKAINFGIIYGMSAKGLAETADMTVPEAKMFIDNYFRLRAPIKNLLDNISRQARTAGYVETFFGRRRPTPDVRSKNFAIRQAAERAAINMPIQGTEADLMKRAMLRVDAALPPEAHLVMQVHDSLIVECPDHLTLKVAEILQREMENVAPELPIKLAAEVTVGENWGKL